MDGCILNAGLLDPVSKIADLDLEAAKTLFDVNVLSLFSMLKHAIPSLRHSKGKVIFVSSGAAVSATAAWGPYSASKAALNSIAATLANEEPEILSVALRPGVVATDMQAQIRSTGQSCLNLRFWLETDWRY